MKLSERFFIVANILLLNSEMKSFITPYAGNWLVGMNSRHSPQRKNQYLFLSLVTKRKTLMVNTMRAKKSVESYKHRNMGILFATALYL
jgi:hypothetical protein